VLAAGFAIFIAGSAGCGLAGTSAWLIAARIAQGAGAALMVPTSLSLLNHACGGDPKLRGRAIAIWTAAGSVGLAAGPLAGGLLIAWFGWRSIFFVNVPLGVLAIWLTLAFVSETTIEAGRKGFDPLGQSLGVVALASLTGAFIEAGARGAFDPLALACFAVAIASGAGFLIAEARGADPMLPLGLFRNLRFSSAILVGLAINLALYGFLFVISLYFQRAQGYSPAQTGLAFLPLSISVGVGNIVAGWLMARTGPRPLMIGGLTGGALGFVLLTGVDAHTAFVALAPQFVLIAFAIGAAVPAMTTALLSTVEKTKAGVASGALNTVRQAAGAIGVALFGAIGGHPEASMTGLRLTFWIGAALLLAGAAIAGFSGRTASR
jgi:DHA2 family methylenomycin A resistance protein-like MFS transporter